MYNHFGGDLKESSFIIEGVCSLKSEDTKGHRIIREDGSTLELNTSARVLIYFGYGIGIVEGNGKCENEVLGSLN